MSKVPSLTLWTRGPEPSGVVQVDVELSGSWTPEAVEAIEGVISTFVEAGQRGAFSAPRVAPALSRVAGLGPAVLSGDVLSVQLELFSVDRRAFQCLRHMVATVYFGRAEPRHVQVRELGAEGLLTRTSMPLVTFDNEGDAYPQPRPSASSGFRVDWPDTEPSKFRVVLVEFSGTLVRSDFVELAGPVGAWGRLVEANAFSLPEVFPDEVECVVGQTVMFDRSTAQIEVPRFIGSEAAWDCLLCLLDAFSETKRKVVLVTVE